LSIEQVNAYEEMQADLAKMWADIELGIIPEPLHCLPGNISVVPTDLLEITSITSSSSSSLENTIITKALLSSDLQVLLREFSDFISHERGKGYKKKMSKTQRREKDEQNNDINDMEEAIRIVLKPYLIKLGSLKGMSTMTIVWNESDQASHESNRYYKAIELFIVELAAANSTSQEEEANKLKKAEEIKNTKVSTCYTLLYRFIKWREEKLLTVEIDRIRAKHKVSVFYSHKLFK
jgi:hypothetical protein